MAVLPLIANPTSYRPCLQDLLADGPVVRNYWLDLFENHIDTLAALPLGEGTLRDHERWPDFRRDYLAGLADLRRNPALRGCLSVLELTRFREEQFAAQGFGDPFTDLKHRENKAALRMLGRVLGDIDDGPPSGRLERLVRGLFAGNIFDMGSKAVADAFQKDRFEFIASRDRIRARPWPVDHLDAWALRLRQRRHAYRQALFFVDNAGPDIVLGVLPLVRHLIRSDIRVVLAANTKPALNDITASELISLLEECRRIDPRLDECVRQAQVTVVASGCGEPLIDLTNLSLECCRAAEESDLLILEGMGRAIESNYDTRFTVDTIKLALIKDPMVAEIIGAKLFDPVFRFEPAA
ncbi:MAG: ARMT1-like domain-containing protein [Planctomycetota bacterium]